MSAITITWASTSWSKKDLGGHFMLVDLVAACYDTLQLITHVCWSSTWHQDVWIPGTGTGQVPSQLLLCTWSTWNLPVRNWHQHLCTNWDFFECAKFLKLAPTSFQKWNFLNLPSFQGWHQYCFHQLKLFDSAKFSKLAPALSWQLAPLGIPTGSCLHLPDCRQLPRHYSHFAATLCYCAQYFCDILCSISALLRAVFCSIGSSVHYVGAHQLWPALSLCTMWSWQLLKLADVNMLSFIYNQFTMFLRLCFGLKVCCGYHILMKREKAWRDQD